MFLLASECRADGNKERLCVDNMVCSLGIDLQSPADMFHFLCALCASLYFTSVLRYRQGNMGGWVMVSISKHSPLYVPPA